MNIVYRNLIVSCILGVLLGLGICVLLRQSAERVGASMPAPVVSGQGTSTVSLSPPVPWISPEELVPSISAVTPSSTRLLFVGDLMLDRNVATRARRSGNLVYPFARLPKDWIKSFDYAVANLEGPLTASRLPPEKSIDFQFDPAFLPILRDQGFDAFSQANNHALDQGNRGYEESVRSLREAGFLVFGHQVRDDEVSLATTTINGIKLAFVGFNSTDNPVDREAAARVIQSAKQQADLVIANMHWGAEYQDRPITSVVELSHWLIDQGVDIVIGGHPHWVQGIFHYKNKPIAYSLGNFVFDQDWSAETKQGMAVELQLDPKNLRAVTIKPIPLQIDASQPRVLEGEMYEKRMEQLANISEDGLKTSLRNGSVSFSW